MFRRLVALLCDDHDELLRLLGRALPSPLVTRHLRKPPPDQPPLIGKKPARRKVAGATGGKDLLASMAMLFRQMRKKRVRPVTILFGEPPSYEAINDTSY